MNKYHDIVEEITNHEELGLNALAKDKAETTRVIAHERMIAIFEREGIAIPFIKSCSLDEAYAYCLGLTVPSKFIL